MKVLILNGSPHMGKGATGIMLYALEKGLQKESFERTTVNLYNLNIKPCQGCFSCWTNTPGKCIIEDDMYEYLPKVAESDVVILATPVYVDGMTGYLKMFLDRLIPNIKGRVELRDDHMRHVPRDEKKQLFALVSPSGFAEMDNFDPLVKHVKAITRNYNAEYAGEVLAPSFWFYRYDEKSYQEALKLITEAGSMLVKTGTIPSNISEKLLKHAPRDKIIKVMNQHYEKYE